MATIEILRRQAVLAGVAWVTEYAVPPARLDAAIEKKAASTKAAVLAGKWDSTGRFIKKSREAIVAEIDADAHAAIAGEVEEKIEFLLDYATGLLEPAQFVSRLADLLALR